MRLVRPSNQLDLDVGDIVAKLRRAHVPETEIASLAPTILALVRAPGEGNVAFDGAEEGRATRFVELVATAFRQHPTCVEAAHLRAAIEIIHWLYGKYPAHFDPVRATATWFEHAPRRDVTAGVAPAVNALDARFNIRLVKRIVRNSWIRGCIQVAQVVEPGLVRLKADRAGLNISAQENDPRCFEFWVTCLGIRALGEFVPALEREPDATVGELAWGATWRLLARLQKGKALACPVLVALEALGRRLPAHRDDPNFLSAYLRLVTLLCAACPELASCEHAQIGLEHARREAGRVRPLLRDAANPASVSAFPGAWTLSWNAIWVIRVVDGLWPALRAVLHAFRQLAVPAVSPDLRYWHEGTQPEQPSQPWSEIPQLFATLIHDSAAKAEVADPGLVELREELATFCLERLKTKPKSKEWVEPDPSWRMAYIDAVRHLGVNPKAKGHHVLHFAMNNDPDPAVRAEANGTYELVRRAGSASQTKSPRRAILTAFWSLRQAHLSALGVEIDPRGAQRTLQKETRRTQEAEDRTWAAPASTARRSKH